MKQTKYKHILVVNDDGIDAPGLRHLVDFAKTIGKVTVVAPAMNQSAKSQAINVFDGLKIERVTYDPEVVAYAVSSTPSDCSRFGLSSLNTKFDLVFSGVNSHLNIAEDIMYSGTVAAAVEGAHLGIPSVAFSVRSNDFEAFVSYAKRVWEFFEKHQLLEEHILWNVNFPYQPQGMQIATQGKLFYSTYFEQRDGLFYQEGEPDFKLDQNPMSDVYAIDSHIVAITPLTVRRDCEKKALRIAEKAV